MASALIEAIKVAGLVLVADTSASPNEPQLDNTAILGPTSHQSANGVNGIMAENGVLRFYDTIDM